MSLNRRRSQNSTRFFWLNGRRIQQVQRDLGTAIAERDAARAELAPLKKALELALARLNGIDL